MLQTISVPLQARSYPIWIESGLINKLPKILKPLNQGQNWVICSQQTIYNHYGETLVKSLEHEKFNVESIIYLDGEDAKSLTTVENIYSKFNVEKLKR